MAINTMQSAIHSPQTKPYLLTLERERTRNPKMMNVSHSWPEPVVRVQSLAESGIKIIPERYIKPPNLRPLTKPSFPHTTAVEIPVINLEDAFSSDCSLRESTLKLVSTACQEMGFFQVVNHGVSPRLMKRIRNTWREFFCQPLEMKQKYANNPVTYEGYGSRLGVEKGAALDWSDYFFLNYLPTSLRDYDKWPAVPLSCRGMVADCGEELVKLGKRIMTLLSTNLGLEEAYLQNAFGGEEDFGVCMRVNYYPKCPQPDLTLGLSPHSDPGGMTILLADDDVAGLQVCLGGEWITVKPVPNSFIINIGDQIQILSNGVYKSVEHRAVVSSNTERLSLAFFYNPRGDLMISPSEHLVSDDRPALYSPMTFNEYRVAIRRNGLSNKPAT